MHNRMVGGIQIVIQVRLCLPFRDDQRGILVRYVHVKTKRSTARGVVQEFEQLRHRLKKLGSLFRIDRHAGCIQNHLFHLFVQTLRADTALVCGKKGGELLTGFLSESRSTRPFDRAQRILQTVCGKTAARLNNVNSLVIPLFTSGSPVILKEFSDILNRWISRQPRYTATSILVSKK